MRLSREIRLGLVAAVQTLLTLALFPCSCFPQASATGEQPRRVTLTEEGREFVASSLKRLSLQEKIGQMLQVRYFADYPDFESTEYRQLREALRRYHIGS